MLPLGSSPPHVVSKGSPPLLQRTAAAKVPDHAPGLLRGPQALAIEWSFGTEGLREQEDETVTVWPFVHQARVRLSTTQCAP